MSKLLLTVSLLITLIMLSVVQTRSPAVAGKPKISEVPAVLGPVAAEAEPQSVARNDLEVVHPELPSERLQVPSTEPKAENVAAEEPMPKEEVWSDIAQAIEGLNEVVGDNLFKNLKRVSDSDMEVAVDPGYWARVQYETRVDLKNDISNIWHLYAQQYNDADASAVFFIDSVSGKTIDIYTQSGGGQ